MKVDGRPLRVLHIGNIANNAFNIAKLQRRAGIEADVLCHSFHHMMSAPEWEDGDFQASIPDQARPRWDLVDMNGYRRPRWFAQGDLMDCVRYLLAVRQGKSGAAERLWTELEVQCCLPRDIKLSARLARLKKTGEQWLQWLQPLARVARVWKKYPVNYLQPHVREGSLARLAIVAASLPAYYFVSALIMLFAFVPALAAALGVVVMAAAWHLDRVRRKVPQHIEAWHRLPGNVIHALGCRMSRWAKVPFLNERRASALFVAPVFMAYYALSIAVATALLVGGVFALPLVVVAAALVRLKGRAEEDVDDSDPPGMDLSYPAFLDRCSRMADEWERLFPDREPLQTGQLGMFYTGWRAFHKLFTYYDVVQAYATECVWPLFCGFHPFVAYEHGTLRGLPTGRAMMDQLAALGYRKSAHAFITNGDCLAAAQALGVTSFSATLHGIDDQKVVPNQTMRQRLLQEYQVERLYLCPIRHSWKTKGTDLYIRALAEIARRTGPSFRLFMFAWGEQVEDSKALARELGVEQFIVWKEPAPHPVLTRWYGAMDCVFDQIALPHFGATAPEAMGCAVPVIMSYDPAATAWIVPEPAPVLSAWNPEAIAAHVEKLMDTSYRQEIGRQGREWFLRNHTSSRLLNDHLEVYARVLTGPAQALRLVA